MTKNEKLKDVMKQINALLVTSGLMPDWVIEGLQDADNVKLNLYEDSLTVRWSLDHKEKSFKVKADAIPKTHIFTETDIAKMQRDWEECEMPALLKILGQTLVTHCWHLINEVALASGCATSDPTQISHFQRVIDKQLAAWKRSQADMGNLELCVPDINITAVIQRERLVLVLSDALQEIISGRSKRRYYTAQAPRFLYRKNEAA